MDNQKNITSNNGWLKQHRPVTSTEDMPQELRERLKDINKSDVTVLRAGKIGCGKTLV